MKCIGINCVEFYRRKLMSEYGVGGFREEMHSIFYDSDGTILQVLSELSYGSRVESIRVYEDPMPDGRFKIAGWLSSGNYAVGGRFDIASLANFEDFVSLYSRCGSVEIDKTDILNLL